MLRLYSGSCPICWHEARDSVAMYLQSTTRGQSCFNAAWGVKTIFYAHCTQNIVLFFFNTKPQEEQTKLLRSPSPWIKILSFLLALWNLDSKHTHLCPCSDSCHHLGVPGLHRSLWRLRWALQPWTDLKVRHTQWEVIVQTFSSLNLLLTCNPAHAAALLNLLSRFSQFSKQKKENAKVSLYLNPIIEDSKSGVTAFYCVCTTINNTFLCNFFPGYFYNVIWSAAVFVNGAVTKNEVWRQREF